MALVNEVSCDQCGKRAPLRDADLLGRGHVPDELRLSPAGWIVPFVIHDDQASFQAPLPTICSWGCLSLFAAGKRRPPVEVAA